VCGVYSPLCHRAVRAVSDRHRTSDAARPPFNLPYHRPRRVLSPSNSHASPFSSTPDYATPVDQQFHVDYDIGGVHTRGRKWACLWMKIEGCDSCPWVCFFIIFRRMRELSCSLRPRSRGRRHQHHPRPRPCQPPKTRTRRADRPPSRLCGTSSGRGTRQVRVSSPGVVWGLVGRDAGSEWWSCAPRLVQCTHNP
jgi:hypothetical protein